MKQPSGIHPLRSSVIAIAVIAVVATVLVGLVPALAHDGHDHDKDNHQSRGTGSSEQGEQLEELPTQAPHPDEPGPPITSREDLERYEAELDPEGSPLSYVCANIGDTEFVVVQGRAAPEGLKANPNAGPLLKSAAFDPCADKSIVVGNK